jgi:UDP-glucose 4-epimerase
MAAYRPDIIFHLAANPLVRDTSPAMVRSNVLGAYNLIEYAPEGARFVLASSATVYGDSYHEKHEWDRLAPTSPYGASKVAAEAFLSVYNQQGRLSGLALRFVAIVGPGATHGVVPDLVAKAQRPGPTLEVLGCPPGSSKPYLHISDALAAMLRFGFDRSIEGAINISPSDQMTSEDIANVVLRTAGQSRALSWSSTWPGDNPSVRVSTSRATALGWAPRMTSEEAIEAAVRGE